LETQLLITQRVGFGSDELLNIILMEVIDEQKMINGFYGGLDRG
jgi:hypothetical protein